MFYRLQLLRSRKNEKGFTLIELIIVIAVLGILATLTIPKVIGVKNNAEAATDEANKKIIRNALERYYADKATYPFQEQGLEVLVEEKYLDNIPEKTNGKNEENEENRAWKYTAGKSENGNIESYTLE